MFRASAVAGGRLSVKSQPCCDSVGQRVAGRESFGERFIQLFFAFPSAQTGAVPVGKVGEAAHGHDNIEQHRPTD